MQRKDLEQGFYRIKETIQFPFPETDNPPVVAPLCLPGWGQAFNSTRGDPAREPPGVQNLKVVKIS